ncbi:hypothetical protein BC938DRAFT_482559 [Jimgerdemannia flammicorona]|uniref:Phosphotransferase n=1 Tax=Jimgerdemannia flammicorona TaxID=994334 RepID=A0A433QDU5_9FUNG|nr:hypothetical protein BC938DRAFT_482559 [Jimgerdemannia flammicorona]
MGADDLLHDIKAQFTFTPEKLNTVINGFNNELEIGLRTASEGLATMIPSFVTSLPTGNEKGTYISLDLGGTNLRAAAVQLLGGGKVEVLEVKSTVTDELRRGSGEALFDWMAVNVRELIEVKAKHLFTAEEIRGDKTLSIGVTWSFPIAQTDINRGNVLRMGKGFILTGIDGRDLVELFHEAFARKKLNVQVTAIVNDTVGTLVAHAYENPSARIGFIYATGVNAAYPERIALIPKLPASIRNAAGPDDFMLINTEIDIFGDGSYLPLTEYDISLDTQSVQAGFQPYEKMMSGMYLGELFRLIASEFIKRGHLFGGQVPKGWDVAYSFETASMGNLERSILRRPEIYSFIPSSDTTKDRADSIELLTNKYTFPHPPTAEDVRTLQQIAAIIATRAAALCAAALASMIKKQNLDDSSLNSPIVIGMNGSTFQFYPRTEERIHAALRQIFGTSVSERIRLEVANDGGTIGAALAAMLSLKH